MIGSKKVFAGWFLVAACIISALCVAGSVAVITTYVVKTPFRLNGTTAVADLKIESLDYGSNYNMSTDTYTSVDVVVYNYGSTTQSGTIMAELYDSTHTVVAYGQNDVTLLAASSTVSVNVPLTWYSAKTIADFATFTLVVT